MSSYKEIFPRNPKDPAKTRIGPWNIYDSSLESYLEDFRRADTEGVIAGFFEKLKAHPAPIVIDFLATTRALRDVKNSLQGKRFTGIAVGLPIEYTHDPPFEYINPLRQIVDELQGVSYIGRDLNKKGTWKEVERKLKGKKAHLIIERGFGGLKYISTSVPYYNLALQKMWSIADPSGSLLLLQTPAQDILEELGIDVEQWFKDLNEQGLYFRYLPNEYFPKIDSYARYGFLILMKNSESPLPLIRRK